MATTKTSGKRKAVKKPKPFRPGIDGPMFDYENAARRLGVPPETVKMLEIEVRADFPHDDMMFELHMLRAIYAWAEATEKAKST